MNAETYEVKNGDTLSEIAIKNNTTIEKLVELNQISNQDLIHAGQIIELGERSNSLINKVNTANSKSEPGVEASTNQVAASTTTAANVLIMQHLLLRILEMGLYLLMGILLEKLDPMQQLEWLK